MNLHNIPVQPLGANAPGLAEEIVSAGLDQILVSLDGATRETYSLYRVNGDFDLVLENVRTLADCKQRLGVRRPLLIRKMVVFPHNSHEVEFVRRNYKRYGFDGYEFVVDNGSRDQQAAWEAARGELAAQERPCYWAWNTAVVGWDGDVQPCCMQINQISLGDAAAVGLRAVWRSEAYTALRRGFARGSYGTEMHPVCRGCLGLGKEAADAGVHQRAKHAMLDSSGEPRRPVLLANPVRKETPAAP